MNISVKTNTYVFLTMLLFFIPVRWIISWVIAISFHELCHFLAVRLCNGKIYHLTIGLGGAEMQCGNMSDKCLLISVLCGPIGGLLLAFLGQWIPRIALCSFVLSLYNLIPLLPLDGGRALYILSGERKWFYFFQKFILIIMFLLALFFAFSMKLGLLPIAIVAILYWKHRKIPCKEGRCRVQ